MTKSGPEPVPPPRRLYPHVLGLLAPLAVEPLIGARYLTTSHWLRDYFAWPEERRRSWQLGRLRDVLRHASLHVPFYRSLAGSSASIALADLPLVDKARIRADMEAFLSDGWERMPRVAKRTGGSTGDPWQYPLDLRAWTHMYAASLHFWERTGYRYGERIVQLGSPPSLHPESRTPKARLRYLVERRIVAAAGVEIDHAASLQRALAAGEADAALWYGYASTVAAMAAAVAAEGRQVPGPRAIVTTSEPLRPEWRRAIEETFRAPVFDEYGCNDGGVLAQSCPRGRFHVAENVSIVEVLEGGVPCPPGIEGDVVVTNLHARVLPFFRYKVGDRAVLGDGTCPCGHAGITLERLTGREGDRLVLDDGKEMSLPALTHCFWDTRNVRRWQIVQQGSRSLVVRLDAAPEFDPHEAELILRALRLQCGDDVEINITTSEPIERTPGGKHKIVIRAYD